MIKIILINELLIQEVYSSEKDAVEMQILMVSYFSLGIFAKPYFLDFSSLQIY